MGSTRNWCAQDADLDRGFIVVVDRGELLGRVNRTLAKLRAILEKLDLKQVYGKT